MPSQSSLWIQIRKSRLEDKQRDKQHSSDVDNESSSEDGAGDIPVAQLINLKKGKGYING